MLLRIVSSKKFQLNASEPLISFVDGSTMAVKIVDSNSPPLIDRVEKFVEGILSILDRFPNPVFDQPAFQVDRFPGRWRQLHPGGILEHPAQLLEIFPCSFP
jgi:hypothetical protein